MQVLKRAQRVEFRSGDVILDSQACHTTLVLLVEGLAKFKFMDEQASNGWRAGSGRGESSRTCSGVLGTAVSAHLMSTRANLVELLQIAATHSQA